MEPRRTHHDIPLKLIQIVNQTLDKPNSLILALKLHLLKITNQITQELMVVAITDGLLPVRVQELRYLVNGCELRNRIHVSFVVFQNCLDALLGIVEGIHHIFYNLFVLEGVL